MSDPRNDDDYLLQLASCSEEYVNRRRSGEPMSPGDFVSEHPDLGDDFHELLPFLDTLEDSLSKTDSACSIPKTFSGYTLIEEIGRGGMGVVYRANQHSLDREVAIKAILPKHSDSSEYRTRFVSEAQIVSKLQHPNIATVFDFGFEGNAQWFSMQLINGERIDHALSRDSEDDDEIDFRRIARLGAEIADALNTAHRRGIYHRDIKPSNLLLDSHGRVWVTDFGLACQTGNINEFSRTGRVIGTAHYAAPEQIRGVSDGRCDIYGLGITLYELVTRSPAWKHMSIEQLVDAEDDFDLKEVRQINPNVPPGLAKIIMKACAFHPMDRYQAAAEMAHVLNRFAAGKKKADRRRNDRFQNAEGRRRRIPLKSLVFFAVLGTCSTLLYQNWDAIDSLMRSTRIPRTTVELASDGLAHAPYDDYFLSRGLQPETYSEESLEFYQNLLEHALVGKFEISQTSISRSLHRIHAFGRGQPAAQSYLLQIQQQQLDVVDAAVADSPDVDINRLRAAFYCLGTLSQLFDDYTFTADAFARLTETRRTRLRKIAPYAWESMMKTGQAERFVEYVKPKAYMKWLVEDWENETQSLIDSGAVPTMIRLAKDRFANQALQLIEALTESKNRTDLPAVCETAFDAMQDAEFERKVIYWLQSNEHFE